MLVIPIDCKQQVGVRGLLADQTTEAPVEDWSVVSADESVVLVTEVDQKVYVQAGPKARAGVTYTVQARADVRVGPGVVVVTQKTEVSFTPGGPREDEAAYVQVVPIGPPEKL
jgi:hypothetical protein